MFFRDTLRNLTSPHFMLIYVEKVRFWNPLQNPMAPKWHPESHFFNINHVNFIFTYSPFLSPRTKCFPRHPQSSSRSHFSWFLKVFGTFSSLILKDFQWLLASLLILNSDIRPNRQTPETLQNSCRDLCEKLLKKRTGKKLAENLQRTSKKLARDAKNLQRTSKKPAKNEFPNSQTAYAIRRLRIPKFTNGVLHSSTR